MATPPPVGTPPPPPALPLAATATIDACAVCTAAPAARGASCGRCGGGACGECLVACGGCGGRYCAFCAGPDYSDRFTATRCIGCAAGGGGEEGGGEGNGVECEAQGAFLSGAWSPRARGGQRGSTEVADDGLVGVGVGDRQTSVDGGGRWAGTRPPSAVVVGKDHDGPGGDDEGDGDPAAAAAAGLLCPEEWVCLYAEEGDLIF
ncbi:hypothetical protein MMPV_009167 [Pyropia vietnamensis]